MLFTLKENTVSSPLGLASFLGCLIAFYLAYCLTFAVYQISFSPLHKIRGPILWITFPVLRHISAVRGNFDRDCRRFFHQYNTDAIRVGPGEVYFNSSSVWQSIYGHGRTPQLPKPFRLLPGEHPHIVNANDIDHTRFRKALAHAFSERALREQESILQGYTKLLIDRLSEKASAGEVSDMTTYYNYTTFDIIMSPPGLHKVIQLIFRREILPSAKHLAVLRLIGYHWYVANFAQITKNMPVHQAQFQYPLLMKITQQFQSKARQQSRARHWQLAHDRVNHRLNNSSAHDRKDFIDFMEKHKGDSDEMSLSDMVSNMFILISAGSDTTATVLAGVTYHLLRHPHALKRITQEIRSTFNSEAEITVQAVTTQLPYTIACLQEALRLYPPVPGSFPRITLQDELITDHLIPKGTVVGVHQTGAYWSETNFHRAMEFVPERWLPQSTDDHKSEFYNDNRKALEPFHIGPRNCIGRNLALAEMRLILTRVVWNFDMELCDGMEGWVKRQKSYILWWKGPLEVRLKKRAVGDVVSGVEVEREG